MNLFAYLASHAPLAAYELQQSIQKVSMPKPTAGSPRTARSADTISCIIKAHQEPTVLGKGNSRTAIRILEPASLTPKHIKGLDAARFDLQRLELCASDANQTLNAKQVEALLHTATKPPRASWFRGTQHLQAVHTTPRFDRLREVRLSGFTIPRNELGQIVRRLPPGVRRLELKDLCQDEEGTRLELSSPEAGVLADLNLQDLAIMGMPLAERFWEYYAMEHRNKPPLREIVLQNVRSDVLSRGHLKHFPRLTHLTLRDMRCEPGEIAKNIALIQSLGVLDLSGSLQDWNDGQIQKLLHQLPSKRPKTLRLLVGGTCLNLFSPYLGEFEAKGCHIGQANTAWPRP